MITIMMAITTAMSRNGYTDPMRRSQTGDSASPSTMSLMTNTHDRAAIEIAPMSPSRAIRDRCSGWPAVWGSTASPRMMNT